VLGHTGRGACEHHGIKPSDITIISASMSTALASIGGFAVSDSAITARQRLSSTGYCFSASLPPFNATAAIEAISLIRAEPERISRLRANALAMHTLLRDMCTAMVGTAADALWLLGDEISPVKHLHLEKGTGNRQEDDDTLQGICDLVLQEAQSAVVVADYSPLQKGAPRPSIRITVSAGHVQADLERLSAGIAKAAAKVLKSATA